MEKDHRPDVPASTVTDLTANRQYKDTVFRMLFSDREALLSLFNAVTGRNYTHAEDLKIVTLKNAIYMGMKNDIAFLLETSIYLYEHQSTKNPNMPLRNLFYISLEFQKCIHDQSLYSSALLKIPSPKFVVFYNGTEDDAEQTVLRLSDAYHFHENDPDLELKVTVFNINEGQNRQMMEKCRLLKDYASYVAHVRRYAAVMDLTDAVRRAVTECIQEGILADFLQRNREEVEMVSILEYDKELEEKKLRKSEYEAGLADGERKGTRLGQAKELVQLCLEFGLDTDSILRKLQEHLAISEEEARFFFEKFR